MSTRRPWIAVALSFGLLVLSSMAFSQFSPADCSKQKHNRRLCAAYQNSLATEIRAANGAGWLNASECDSKHCARKFGVPSETSCAQVEIQEYHQFVADDALISEIAEVNPTAALFIAIHRYTADQPKPGSYMRKMVLALVPRDAADVFGQLRANSEEKAKQFGIWQDGKRGAVVEPDEVYDGTTDTLRYVLRTYEMGLDGIRKPLGEAFILIELARDKAAPVEMNSDDGSAVTIHPRRIAKWSTRPLSS